MIFKSKINGKIVDFFYYKRCTFLFCFFFVLLVRSQIFVTGGALIFDKDNSITGNVVIGGNEVSQKSAEAKLDSDGVASSKKIRITKPKILITKKEIIGRKIEKQSILNKDEEQFNFASNDLKNATFITSGNSHGRSAIVHKNNYQIADFEVPKFRILHRAVLTNRQELLLIFIYKYCVAYFYSVRPPPHS